MIRYIKRIKPTKSGWYPIQRSLSCGDGYKFGNEHHFFGTKQDVKILTFLMQKLGVKVSEIKYDTVENNINGHLNQKWSSFKFSAKTRRLQTMMFRICRYTRHEALFEILTLAKKLIEKHNIKPFNSLLIAHMEISLNRDGRIPNFSASMDIFSKSRSYGQFNTFRSKKEFNQAMNIRGGSNTIFESVKFKNIESKRKLVEKIKKLLREENYKEVQRCLYVNPKVSKLRKDIKLQLKKKAEIDKKIIELRKNVRKEIAI